MAISTMATTMAILNTKCITPTNTIKMAISSPSSKPTSKPISLLSIQNLPMGLINPTKAQTITTGAIAGAIFTTLGSMDSAMAAQQLADIAEGGDNRGLALLLPLIPAIGWVLYNILQPALNQINKMRSERSVIIGLGGLGLSGLGLLFSTQEAQAVEEIGKVAAAAASSESDSRGLLLLIVVLPAIGWVLFNILQPALNQINKMRSQ